MLATMSTKGVWIGHLYLRPPGADAAQARDVVQVQLEEGHDLGPGMLALRLLAPLAALPAARRTEMHVLLAGGDLELALVTCQALSCDEVHTWDGGEDMPVQRFHRVLFGCKGRVPNLDELKPLIARLREDGQLGLFNLPAKQIIEAQKSLAKAGFALRAAGSEGDYGYLAGRVESPAQFQSA